MHIALVQESLSVTSPKNSPRTTACGAPYPGTCPRSAPFSVYSAKTDQGRRLAICGSARMRSGTAKPRLCAALGRTHAVLYGREPEQYLDDGRLFTAMDAKNPYRSGGTSSGAGPENRPCDRAPCLGGGYGARMLPRTFLCDRYAAIARRIRSRVNACKGSGSVALLGVGHLGVTFTHLMGLAGHIGKLWDDHPASRGIM